MNFTDPSKIEEIVWQMKFNDLPRAQNRANLQRLYNGEKPYTDQQAIDNCIQTNVNFLEGTKILHDARQQWNNAFLKTSNFFTVSLTKGDPIKRKEWASIITTNVNRIMKKSEAYMEMFQAIGANVFLHGPGPSQWVDKYTWCPIELGIEDLLVPSNTRKSLKNLTHFAIYRTFTYGELYKLTHGSKNIDPGWNMALVDKTLSGIKDENTQAQSEDIVLNPEKLAERYKANCGYYDSDATPTIKTWEFYFEDDEKKCWNRRIVLDCATKEDFKKQFLYEKDDYAKERSEIIHIQFADGANKAPFYYHSVRSLGWLLYDVCRLQNRLRSKFNDAVFEQMLWYFIINNPEDRDRLQKIELSHMGIIPEGMSFVKAQDRFQPRADLVSMAMGQNRQNMAENSSSFTQEVNDGTSKEMTATETMARVNSASQLVSAMMNLAYGYETFRYIEICRRFCLKGSPDKDVQKFQKQCKDDGVPDDMMNSELWDVMAERSLGAGNKMYQIAQTDKLMAALQVFEPDAQKQIIRMFTSVNTDDPRLAMELVPESKNTASDAVVEGQWASGTLMNGLPMAVQQGINHIDYVGALMVAMGVVIGQIEQMGGMATPQQLFGLQNISAHIQQHVAIIARNPANKSVVKQIMDKLGNYMNMIKGYQQRLQEQMQAAQAQTGGLSAEDQAKIKSAEITTNATMALKAQSHAQKEQQRAESFQSEQQRKNLTTAQTLKHQQVQTSVDIADQDAQSAADIARKANQPAENQV